MTIQPNAIDQIQNLTHEIIFMSDELYQSSRNLDGKELGDLYIEEHTIIAIAKATKALELLKLSVNHIQAAAIVAHGREIQPKV